MRGTPESLISSGALVKESTGVIRNNKLLVTTSKAPVTTSDALVTSECVQLKKSKICCLQRSRKRRRGGACTTTGARLRRGVGSNAGILDPVRCDGPGTAPRGPSEEHDEKTSTTEC